MREIKFRAKRADNNEWWYGDLVKTHELEYPEDIPQMSNYAIINHDFEPKTPNNTRAVDKNTIGQFTGLKDKNDKEIYEGDIVEIKYVDGLQDFLGNIYYEEVKFVELVVFKDQAFQLEFDNCGLKQYRYLKARFDDRIYASYNPNSIEIEVIGNIYDNKDLLKRPMERRRR